MAVVCVHTCHSQVSSFADNVWRQFSSPIFVPCQVCGQRRDGRVFPVQDESPVCIRGRWRSGRLLFRHARSRVRLRLPSSQSEASVHFLPGQRALLQTSTPQDCSLSRDPAGLPGVCQKAGVRQELRVSLCYICCFWMLLVAWKAQFYIKGSLSPCLRFTTGHIWACPPSEGDDYIFHCHPLDQKIPKPKRLQEWYKKMLDKAVSERVVHDYKVRRFSPNSHALCLVVPDSLSKWVHLQAVLVGTLVVSCGFLRFPSPWTVFNIVFLHALCDPLKPH